jgi:hypothetical protein
MLKLVITAVVLVGTASASFAQTPPPPSPNDAPPQNVYDIIGTEEEAVAAAHRQTALVAREASQLLNETMKARAAATSLKPSVPVPAPSPTQTP